MEDYMRQQRREEYWQEHYREFKKSGLTQRAYCREKELSYWAFNPWKRRFDNVLKDMSLQEIPVKFVPEKISEKKIEIILKDNLRISVPEKFSSETLKMLMKLLGYNI
jgi:tagatose-1,6-bisphosphate aldolase non-catalytic subunit AgaZ/GatZ